MNEVSDFGFFFDSNVRGRLEEVRSSLCGGLFFVIDSPTIIISRATIRYGEGPSTFALSDDKH